MRALRLPAAIAAAALSMVLAGCGGGGGGSPGSNNPALVHLLTNSVPDGTTGVFYDATFQADFPNPPGVFYVVAGTLPPGSKLDKHTGQLSGYLRQVGTFNFSIGARDGSDPGIPGNRDPSFGEDRKDYTVTVALGPPNLLPQAIPAAQFNSSYGYQLDVAGGTAPYSFALTGGALPNGITVSSTGFLGNFAAQGGAAPFDFTVTVTDANGLTDTENFQIQVVTLPLIILTSDPIPQGAMNFPYFLQLQLASSGGGAPITWSQNPPAAGETDLTTIGMEITPGGALQNQPAFPGPTAIGTFTFTAKVVDFAAQVATRTYHLTINPGPVLNSITPNRSTTPGPYTASGLNFQPGAKLIFKPGPNQVIVTPVFVSSTTLTFNATPATPAGGGGAVPVQVLNPDNGSFTKPAAFIFAASNIIFSTTASFPTPQTSLSSTGLDTGDVNKDGFADFVHCGSNSAGWGNATGTNRGVDLMLNNPAATGGTFNVAAPAFTRVQLSTTDDWYGVRLADVDSDGDLDVVAIGRVGGSNVVRAWINPYPAAFTAAASFQTTTLNYQGTYTTKVNDMSMGKITGPDVLPDLAYAMQDGFHSSFNGSTFVYTGGSVATMKGNGTGTFSGIDIRNAIVDNLGSGGGVTTGQFNGDTQADTVVSDGLGGADAWWSGRGTQGQSGLFLPSSSSTGFFAGLTPLARSTGAGVVEHIGATSGDVNGDGRDDLVIPAHTILSGGTAGLYAYSGSSGGTFTQLAVTNPATVPAWRYPCVFDADFDVPLDIAVTSSGGRIDFFHGRTGTTGPQWKQTVTITTNAPNLGRIAAGDFDADGRPDVVVCTSFLSDFNNPFGAMAAPTTRGLGGVQGVFILLNNSN
jgi:hypothetical protein